MLPLRSLSVRVLSVAGVLVASLLAGGSLAGGAQAATLCPEHLTENGKFHMLQDMKIYDGPEASESEILPELSGKTASWNIATVRAAGADPQVKCSFKHTSQTQLIAVPPEAKPCRFVATYPSTSICE